MYQVTEKDYKRIKDIVTKSNGNKDKELQLAKLMADKITGLFKAMARYSAAKELKKYHLAEIFLTRAEELDKDGIYTDEYVFEKAKKMAKALK